MRFFFIDLSARVAYRLRTVAWKIHLQAKSGETLARPVKVASTGFLREHPSVQDVDRAVVDGWRYRFLDMTRYGAPLTLGIVLIVPWLICRHFGL